MATLRDIKRRIRSVQSTRQITKAMEMVAAAKLRKAQSRALDARPYAQGMVEVLQALASSQAAQEHPLFQKRAEVRARAMIVVAADRGLCGAYNANVLRAAEAWQRKQEGGGTGFYLVGRKSIDFMVRRRRNSLARFTDLPALADFVTSKNIAEAATSAFLKGEVDEVQIAYTHFVSTSTRRVVIEPFLPIQGEEVKAGARAKSRDFILEPNAEKIFEELLPRYVATRIFRALADAYASEHSARMIAMGSANKNAGEMIDSLILTRNRLRQAAITKEIAEIVGGAEALA